MRSSRAHDTVERQADQADDDHARDHEIVAITGVARVHDHVAEPRAQRDHFRGDDDQPGDAEPDAHADQDLRQHGRNDDLREQRRARHAEVLRRAQVALLDRVHADRRLHDHREHRRDEDQVDRRGVADAEPQDRDRDPGDRRDRAQHLEDRIQRVVRAAHPAHPQPERHGDAYGEREARADAHERRADVSPQRAVLQAARTRR